MIAVIRQSIVLKELVIDAFGGDNSKDLQFLACQRDGWAIRNVTA